MDNEPKPKWTYLSAPFVSFCGTLASILCLTSIHFGISESNVPYSTEYVTYLVVMIYMLLVLSTLKLNLRHYHNFLRELRKDFKYICNKGAKFRVRYFENHLLTWKVTLLTAIFVLGIGSGMISLAILSLIIYLYTHEPGKRVNRPLPFQFWIFDIDLQQTPTYEISFVLGCMCIASQNLVYLFSVVTNIIWIRQIMLKADLVIWSIQDLLVDVHPILEIEEERRLSGILKERMRDIIIKHQSMFRLLDEYAGVYKKMFIFEQKINAPMICLTAYCTAESIDEGDLNAIALLLFICIVVAFFIPSFLCTLLADKIISICDACWDIPYWRAGRLMKVLKPYLVLIIQKSLQPLVLKSAGFEDISIRTYSKNVSTAYSWFNMLRQANI
uniref:Odorant receptor n=1 Tax=Dendrolimus punctatus TaxID=238572 RepID=A0A2K8GKV4_9NEOP|nr:Odorant Receptor 51 [Dendrolimus punctatus]